MKILFFITILSVDITSYVIADVDHSIEGNDNLIQYFQQRMIVSTHRPTHTEYSLQNLNNEDFKIGWDKFKEINSKEYSSGQQEETQKKIFLNNLKKIVSHNVKFLNNKTTYKMGINPEADISDENFIPIKCNDGHKARQEQLLTVTTLMFSGWLTSNPFLYLNASSNLDYRLHNIVHLKPDKQNIYYCCSSYALATTSAVESHLALQNRKLIKLSAQQIIDNTCQQSYGNQGCNGGSVLQSFGYVKDIGLASADSYKYREVETLVTLEDQSIVTKINSIVKIENEMEIKLALKHGPVVSFVNINLMRFYRDGIFYEEKCSKNTNHAILIVGYGIEQTPQGAQSFWIIQNYWGNTWGNKGFMKILKGSTVCGIGLESYFPKI